MKKSKKAISVLLSLLLMFNLFIPAYAPYVQALGAFMAQDIIL